ncbi:hypothetical protein EVJ58_g9360 [Rhodofomes roseus]|uniref:Uncharacterized protein n=1 Tax=Rhodofomes roseus TaxID=34475 RepID=A0A4Y9XU03_9APHY|nr:hypothetical protein EVJ58_g9360 [Rhodofomes roseus]
MSKPRPPPSQATNQQKKKKKNATKTVIAHIGLGLPTTTTIPTEPDGTTSQARTASGQRKRRRTSDRVEDGGAAAGAKTAARVQNTPSPPPERTVSPIDELDLTQTYNSDRDPTIGDLDVYNGLDPRTINPVNRPPPYLHPTMEWDAPHGGTWATPTAQEDIFNWREYIQRPEFEPPQTQQPRTETPGYFEDPEMDNLIRTVGFPTLYERTPSNDPQGPVLTDNQRHRPRDPHSQSGPSRPTAPTAVPPLATNAHPYTTSATYPPPTELRTYARNGNGQGPRVIQNNEQEQGQRPNEGYEKQPRAPIRTWPLDQSQLPPPVTPPRRPMRPHHSQEPPFTNQPRPQSRASVLSYVTNHPMANQQQADEDAMAVDEEPPHFVQAPRMSRYRDAQHDEIAHPQPSQSRQPPGYPTEDPSWQGMTTADAPRPRVIMATRPHPRAQTGGEPTGPYLGNQSGSHVAETTAGPPNAHQEKPCLHKVSSEVIYKTS